MAESHSRRVSLIIYSFSDQQSLANAKDERKFIIVIIIIIINAWPKQESGPKRTFHLPLNVKRASERTERKPFMNFYGFHYEIKQRRRPSSKFPCFCSIFVHRKGSQRCWCGGRQQAAAAASREGSGKERGKENR